VPVMKFFLGGKSGGNITMGAVFHRVTDDHGSLLLVPSGQFSEPNFLSLITHFDTIFTRT